MRPRPAVLPTPTSSSHRSPLLSRQQLSSLTPLAATLMDFPASVANKRLTAGLNPLDATLTENREERGVMVNQHPPELDVWTFRRSDVAAFQRTFHSLFSLFAQRVFHNSFAFTGIRTLSENCRGVPQQFPFWNPAPRLIKRMRIRPLAFSSPMYSICPAPDGSVQPRATRDPQRRHGKQQQRSKSLRVAAGWLPVTVRPLHRPQNYRPQLSLARAVQRFSRHGDVAAHAHPPGLAERASTVSLEPGRFAGPFCSAHHSARFADGFSGAHCGAAGRLRKLFSAAANWCARNGFSHAEPARVLGHGGLALWLDRDIFYFAAIRHHAVDRQRGYLLRGIPPQRAQFQRHHHRLARPRNDSPSASADRLGLVHQRHSWLADFQHSAGRMRLPAVRPPLEHALFPHAGFHRQSTARRDRERRADSLAALVLVFRASGSLRGHAAVLRSGHPSGFHVFAQARLEGTPRRPGALRRWRFRFLRLGPAHVFQRHESVFTAGLFATGFFARTACHHPVAQLA